MGGCARAYLWRAAAHAVPAHGAPVPGARAAEFGEALLPLLSDRLQFSARKRVEGLLRQGLAVYVYYYPGMPIRLAHAIGSFPGSFGVGDAPAAPLAFDIDAAVVSWTDLFARMLVAGFVPTTPVHTGNCLQSQNLAIDGGLCDVDSLEPVSALGKRELASALSYSLGELAKSISRATSIPFHVTAAFTWAEIARLTRQMAEGRACDPRILELAGLVGLPGLRWFARAASG